ncbi:MAG: energy transducer TonB, partial [Candidatus Accumulibacter sp.]|nr:energy transducer TonB [Accumulibacter sp.]
PPVYPEQSRRLGEQGLVVARVLIGADGRPKDFAIKRSSGYVRLDKVVGETVMRWRYVPGMRNGVAEAMWYDVPLKFSLK